MPSTVLSENTGASSVDKYPLYTFMSAESKAFSARVDLPCRVFCGPDAMLELPAVAVSIDTGSVVLAVRGGHAHSFPMMGERVSLEMLLPVNGGQAKAKCLTVRAKVVRMTEMPDGSRQIGLSFRKASFKDVAERVLGKPRKGVKAAVTGWEM